MLSLAELKRNTASVQLQLKSIDQQLDELTNQSQTLSVIQQPTLLDELLQAQDLLQSYLTELRQSSNNPSLQAASVDTYRLYISTSKNKILLSKIISQSLLLSKVLTLIGDTGIFNVAGSIIQQQGLFRLETGSLFIEKKFACAELYCLSFLVRPPFPLTAYEITSPQLTVASEASTLKLSPLKHLYLIAEESLSLAHTGDFITINNSIIQRIKEYNRVVPSLPIQSGLSMRMLVDKVGSFEQEENGSIRTKMIQQKDIVHSLSFSTRSTPTIKRIRANLFIGKATRSLQNAPYTGDMIVTGSTSQIIRLGEYAAADIIEAERQIIEDNIIVRRDTNGTINASIRGTLTGNLKGNAIRAMYAVSSRKSLALETDIQNENVDIKGKFPKWTVHSILGVKVDVPNIRRAVSLLPHLSTKPEPFTRVLRDETGSTDLNTCVSSSVIGSIDQINANNITWNQTGTFDLSSSYFETPLSSKQYREARTLLSFDTFQIKCVSFTPDGFYILTIEDKKGLVIRKVINGQVHITELILLQADSEFDGEKIGLAESLFVTGETGKWIITLQYPQNALVFLFTTTQLKYQYRVLLKGSIFPSSTSLVLPVSGGTLVVTEKDPQRYTTPSAPSILCGNVLAVATASNLYIYQMSPLTILKQKSIQAIQLQWISSKEWLICLTSNQLFIFNLNLDIISSIQIQNVQSISCTSRGILIQTEKTIRAISISEDGLMSLLQASIDTNYSLKTKFLSLSHDDLFPLITSNNLVLLDVFPESWIVYHPKRQIHTHSTSEYSIHGYGESFRGNLKIKIPYIHTFHSQRLKTNVFIRTKGPNGSMKIDSFTECVWWKVENDLFPENSNLTDWKWSVSDDFMLTLEMNKTSHSTITFYVDIMDMGKNLLCGTPSKLIAITQPLRNNDLPSSTQFLTLTDSVANEIEYWLVFSSVLVVSQFTDIKPVYLWENKTYPNIKRLRLGESDLPLNEWKRSSNQPSFYAFLPFKPSHSTIYLHANVDKTQWIMSMNKVILGMEMIEALFSCITLI